MGTRLIDIIDFEQVNVLLEGFNKSTGFVTAILDLDGNILSQSGWQSICTAFHRVNPETSKRCTISDTIIAGKLAAGKKYHSYKCLNGLIDVAVPLIINKKHIANLFTGQFFFEKPDRNFFIQQAKKYGFDEKVYLKSLDKVPIVSENHVKHIMEFLLNMTQVISQMTFQKVEQIELNKQLKESEGKYKALIENLPQRIFSKNEQLKYITCNENFANDLNETVNGVIGKSDYGLFPKGLAEKYRNDDRRIIKNGKTEEFDEKYIQDGNEKIVHTVKTPLLGENGKVVGVMGIFWDVTELKKAEDELLKYKEHLEKLVKERTKELEEKYKELENMNKLFVGRELRMIELKEKIKFLENNKQ